MIGRLIERLFVQVRADMTDLSRDLQQGVTQTRQATGQMAMNWGQVSSQVELFTRKLVAGKITQAQYTSEMNRLSSVMKGVAGSYREAQKEVWGYAAAQKAASQQVVPAFDTKPVVRFNRSLGQSRMQMMNLGYQLNDIGMTLATGMNPMTVLIQQGSQILQIYAGQGGLRTALGDISKILMGIGKRVWPIAVLAAGFGMVQREINKTSKTAVTFMDTTKAIFQVLGGYIYKLIEGPLNDLTKAWNASLDFIAEWFPKIMNAVIGAVVGSVRTIGAVWNLLPSLWHDTWAQIKDIAIDFIEPIANFMLVTLPEAVLVGVNKMVQLMVFAFRAIGAVWDQFPAIMSDSIGGAVNFMIEGVEKMVNGAIQGINTLLKALQSVVDFIGADKALEFFGFSGTLPTIDEQDLSKWRMETGTAIADTTAAIGAEAARTFNENFVSGITLPSGIDLSGSRSAYRNAFQQLGSELDKIFSESMNFDYMGKFFDDVKTQAIENALARIAKGEKDVGKAAKEAAKEVKTLMEQLDEQLTTAADNLAAVFGNAFERLAETGRFTFSDFVKDLNQLIIKSTSELLQQELSNMFKSLATSQGGLGSLFSNLFTSLFGGGGLGFGIPARASGGVEMPWRNFIAGEQGAELINQDGPGGARRIMSAGRTRNAMNGAGGSGPTVNMYVQTPDVQSFQKSQSQLASRMSMFMARGRRNQ